MRWDRPPKPVVPRAQAMPSKCVKCQRFLTRKLRQAKRCSCGAALSGLFKAKP